MAKTQAALKRARLFSSVFVFKFCIPKVCTFSNFAYRRYLPLGNLSVSYMPRFTRRYIARKLAVISFTAFTVIFYSPTNTTCEANITHRRCISLPCNITRRRRIELRHSVTHKHQFIIHALNLELTLPFSEDRS